MENEQNSFTGWAIVEMMGHRREIGYVTTEHYGAASLFRVDSPEFEEREWALTKPQWVTTDRGVDRMAPIGSKVKRVGIPAKSCLIGPASVYALNPCTEEMARKAIEEGVHRPIKLLEIPGGTKLLAAENLDDDEKGICEDCKLSVLDCECIPY